MPAQPTTVAGPATSPLPVLMITLGTLAVSMGAGLCPGVTAGG